MVTALVLRDIHTPPPPPWWPPAPGWWLLAALLLALLAGGAWWLRRRRQRRARIMALFDTTVAAASTAPEQLAAISELLRRAARRRDPAADRLQGEAWLGLLNGDASGKTPPCFAGELGQLLLDGGFRRDVDIEQVERLRPLARARFLEWMGVR